MIVRNIILTLIKSIIGIFVVCIIFEIFLRILSPYSAKIKFFTHNPYTRKLYESIIDVTQITTSSITRTQFPGTEQNGFITNSKGFLTPEVPYAKPIGIKRVVIIGDSQGVACIPYLRNFIRILESNFNSYGNQKYEFINLSVATIGPKLETDILTLEGLKYSPDLILWLFNVGNDFIDDNEWEQQYNELNTNVNISRLLKPNIYNSYLISFLRNYIIYLHKSSLVENSISSLNNILGTYTGHFDYNPNIPTFTKKTFLKLETDRLGLFNANSDKYSSFTSIKQTFLEVKKMSDKVKSKFLVIIIPEEMQVDAELYSEVLIANNRDNTNMDITVPQRKLANIFDELNIPYVNLLSIWGNDKPRNYYHLLQNTHLNEYAHASIAAVLEPMLLSELNK
jgi:hypothetical protein